MTLLLRDPDVQAEEAAAAPPEQAPEGRACPTCEAPMAGDQDWCLQCGQAAPGRLGARPGMRAAATVIALTLLLVGGAVAASYAALQSSATREAAKPAPPSAAPVVPAPAPAPAPTATTPPAATPPPATTTLPSTGTTKPKTPAPSPTPTPTPAPAPAPSTSTGSTGTTTTGTTPTNSGSTTTTTTPKPVAPKPIVVAAGAVSIYDPYSRATAKGEPARAVDGNPDTSWFATVADGSNEVGAGLIVDLGKARGIREAELATKTPGFRTEIYATDSADVPPDVLDTRWAHIKDVSKVGASGSPEKIVLGGGSTKYRYVLLWFTSPPTDGPTVRVSELSLLG